MPETIIIGSIQNARKTKGDWEAQNPVLKDGQVVIEIQPDGSERTKCGNGVSDYNSRPYLNGGEVLLANVLTSNVSITRVGATVTVEGPVSWRINSADKEKLADTVFVITAATDGFFRKDRIYGTAANTILILEGEEGEDAVVAPDLPADCVSIAIVDVFGDDVSDPAPDLTGYASLVYVNAQLAVETLDKVIDRNPYTDKSPTFGGSTYFGLGLASAFKKYAMRFSSLVSGSPVSPWSIGMSDDTAAADLQFTSSAPNIVFKQDGRVKGSDATEADDFVTKAQLDAGGGGGGGASSFDELSGDPYDNADLATALTTIEDKADAAQTDIDSHEANTSNPHSVTKTQVGLGNVDNTPDTAKPVSTAQQAALDAKADLVGGVVPSAQLPSFVDDVLEFADLASFPGTGTSGKIYLAIDTNKSYRWSGSTYVHLDDSIALGETSSTAYRGDRGKSAYDHSQITSGNPHGTVPSDIVGFDAAALSAAPAETAATVKAKLTTATTDDISIEGSTNKWWTNARSIASVLTGFASSAGTVASTDTILQAFQKIVGNIALKVTANAPITGATKTKLTYDSNGLVTGGADATTADIADSTDKRYQTDAQRTNNDATSPIQGQLNAKADLVGGFVPSSQLPSFVDDVLEYADLASFPATGVSGKIYVAIDTNKSYRWSGSTYVHLDDSVALGETSATAYRGDRGKTAYDHSQILTGNPHGTAPSDITGFNAAALAAAPAETTTTIGALINGATNKATPVDADYVGLMDSAASNVLKKLSWANVKATLKTYFDTLYVTSGSFATLTDAATVNWDMTNKKATVTLAGNRTLAVTNAINGGEYMLIIKQDATGSRTLSLPAGWKVVNGGAGAIVLTTTASAIDAMTVVYDGTNYFVSYGRNWN